MIRTGGLRVAMPCLAAGALLVAAELCFRVFLFSDLSFMQRFRDPSLYASYFSDDEYWLLHHRFGGQWRPPERAHPLLGWVGAFDRDRLTHDSAPHLRGRRPVLLYGDSFAACVEAPCFQDVLNQDPVFSRKCFVLNYGVGGYGLDQIHLLAAHTVSGYQNPLVVFSLLTEDLDRTVLAVRTGQKPRFTLESDRLRLTGVPIDADPAEFFARTRPRIPSYLYRMALHGNVLPSRLAALLNGEEASRGEKIALGRAILKQTISDLRERGLESLFLVFVGHWPGESSIVEDADWRLDAVVSILREEKVRYVTTKDIIREDMADSGRSVDEYFLLDGHYNGATNRLIAQKLKPAFGTCAS